MRLEKSLENLKTLMLFIDQQILCLLQKNMLKAKEYFINDQEDSTARVQVSTLNGQVHFLFANCISIANSSSLQ